MSNDEQADPLEKPRDEDAKAGSEPGSMRKPLHIDDIMAEARKKTKAAAEAEGMSIETYEQIERAIEEGRDGDYTGEDRETVERIQESYTAETFARVQSVIAQPWLQTYAASNIFQNVLGRETSGIMQNLKNVLASQNSWKAIQTSFASTLPRNLTDGVKLSRETMKSIQQFAVPNQELIKSLNPIADTFNGLWETLQDDARAALIAGFATKTQKFLTTDTTLRYRWNRPVWHYTNGYALLSILNNGQLWASSPESLNDASEMMHGFEIIKKAFDDQEDYNLDKTVKAVLSQVLDEHYFNSIINDVYYISASSEQDSLTLWRNYADGDGFAIGIDAAVELFAEGIAVDETNDREHIRSDIPLISGWYRVSYRKLEKQKLAKQFVQNAIEDIGQTAKRDQSDLTHELRKQAVILASVMKHEAFKDEREVRWITTNFTTFDPVHYEHGRKSIVPVLHVMTSSAEDNQPLPLKGLRCSPIPNDSIVRTMQGLLEQRGYGQASKNVKKSKQPFKG